MKIYILLIVAMLFPPALMSQDISRSGEVDIFMGIDFNYRDIYFNKRNFDVLINLTPGVRWNIGRRWDVAAQLYVPVINQFGNKYKNVRIRVASLSKQLAIGSRWKMKISGGIFTADSYGIDIKNMIVIKPWLAVTAQIGLTGYLSMASGWKMSTMKKLTFMAGRILSCTLEYSVFIAWRSLSF